MEFATDKEQRGPIVTSPGVPRDRSCIIPGDSLDAFPDAFIELDRDGLITAWNQRAEAIFGWSSAEAIGLKFCHSMVSSDHQKACGKAFAAFRDAESDRARRPRIEIQCRRRDNQEVPVELSLFFTRQDEFIHLGFFARDISQRRQMEQDAEQQLHSLIDQLGEEYFETDLRGNYTFANTRLCEYFQIQSGADLTGKNFEAFFSPEDIKMFKENFREVYLTGERKRQELSIVLNGRLIYVEHTVSLKRDSNGQPIGFIVLSRDCTERKLAQMQLAKAMEAAQAASKAKSEFLANMSHEIRTPLNGVVGALDLAHDTNVTPEQAELLEMASASANALLGVINDILDFSKIEAGKLQFESIEFEMREVVAEALRSLAIRAHQKGLELVYDVAPDIPRFLLGDPARLMQVLLNLIGNAIKFTAQGEVALHVERVDAEPDSDQAQVRFSVSDTGIGIESDKKRLIFDAFAQADSSTTRRYGGTGLGLAISSRLVQRMGGELSVDSEPGRGSTFHFRATFDVGTGGRSEVATSRQQLRGLRALIVDDNQTNRRILEKLLASWGMIPVTADGGEAALELMQKAADSGAPFPVVLTDCRMPEMDGFQLVGEIRNTAALATASIMMLTSDDYHHTAARCREMGIGKYLIKPIKQSELFNALCGLLQAPATHGEVAPIKSRQREQGDARALDILLAEDNLINQRLTGRMIEKLGHRVVIAGTGREALAKLEAHTFDLVLMDVQMPEMDGPSAVAAIRERESANGRHLPIIALTAHAMSGDRQHCLDAGMDDYLSKPVDFKQLEQTIARVMRGRIETPVDGTHRDVLNSVSRQ
jgi:two-component system, sensor histidine kinase and response regulator